MYTSQQGDKVSVEEMQNLAQEAGVSVEVYAKAAGYSLQSEEVTKDPEPKKATGAAQGVVAGPQIPQEITPGFMPQPVETPESTELASEDTSLDSPDPEPRFIEFKGKGDRPGAIVYEDTYLETKAGQPGYPDTFDEYAAAFNTTPQSSSTEEIAIKATSSEKVFESLSNSFKGISFNQSTGGFDSKSLSDLDNIGLFKQEEEVSKKTFNKLFAGSGVDFVETDFEKKQTDPLELMVLGTMDTEGATQLGSEALRARIKNPKTGEYIYSEILELESDGSFKNNDKIQEFLDKNKSYLDLPKWTRSKNKMIAKYKQWKNSELDPIINKARVEAEQAYIINPDLFKPYDKKINVGGYNTSTTVTETINPYQKEIAQEVNRLERKGVKENLEAQAKINVRQNLKQADINEAIRETRAKFINASSNKEEAQAFLYASETFVKQEKAKAYNENNEGSQVAAEGANKYQKLQQFVIDVSRATPSKNQSDDDFITQQKNKLQPIIDELNIEIPEDTKEKINSPKLNMLLGLDEDVLLPKSFYNIMMALEDAKNANISDYNNKRIKMAESIGDILDIDVAMEATAKNYELVEKYAVNAGLGLQDIAVNVGMLGLNILSLGQSEKVAQLGSDYVEYTKEIRDSYQRDVSFDEAFSTPENTTKFIFQEVSNQLPIFLAMAASGGSAAYVIGASSAGGKMMDMQNEIATGTAEYSPIKLWGTTFGYGVAEGLFAQLTTVPILRRAKLNWMNNGKESIVNNSMREYAKTQYKGLIYEPILEASGEAANVGMQNLMDGKPFMQGMDHASTSGLAFGFAFSAIPFLKGMYNSQFSTYKTRSEIRTMQNDLDGLNKELNMSLLNTPSSGINFFKGKQDLLKRSIEEKSIQLADKIKQQEVIVANNLTEGAKNEVVKIINRQAELENKAIEIQKNPNISNKERAALIAEIKADYDIVVKARNEAVKDETMLKNGTEWAAFKGLNRSESQEYLDTADAMLSGERNGKQASKEDINDRAYDLYFGDKVRVENKKLGRSNSSLFKNFKSFDTVDEAVTEVNNDDTIAPEDKKEIILKLKNGNDGYWNPASGTMVAIVENQVKNQRKYTKTHEVGHKAFEMLLGNPENSAAFKGISDQLLSTLKATDRKTYDKFIKDGIDDDAGNIDPTEVISRFMEYVADDQITNVQKAKGISGLFGVMIQKTFGSDYKFDFRGEQDIFNFVVGLGKKLKDGTLTTADIKKAKESKVIKDLPTSDLSSETSNKVSFSKQLTPEQDTQLRSDVAEIKKEASEGEALAKKFGKDFVKGAKQTRLENKVLQEIKPIVDRVVTNRTKALYDPIAEDAKKNVSRQMFQESMRSDIESMVFDEFTGKQDLEKFIVNRAFLRANNLAERLGIKGVEEGITKGLEAAEKVAVEETTATKADRPKYRNILKSNTLPTETVNNIKDKVLRTVRTLKSKLDTKVSKNKTVTPLIAEIKKNMGKQADIDFKKAMGGKKDAQLRRFLIKNKKAILENMTTTWLMGAMPGAVQKQVNGSFTSDWQGKKIDREKTSTQQAGRTSGADIVRRLPNAFKNLDDKTYLSYIVDESGAPIRGRKESLAKAMAEELSFDIFTAELQNENSDIRKAFESNQEALGVVLADNFVQEITRDVERGTVKLSQTLNNLKRVDFFVKEINTSKFRETLLTTKDLNKAIKIHFKNDFTRPELRDIAKEVAKNNLVKNFEFQIEKVGIEKAADMVVDFAGEVLFTPSEYKTIMAKYGLESNYNLRSLQAVNEGRLAALWLKDKMKESRFVRGFYRALSGPARLAGFELKTDPDGIIVSDSDVKKEVKSPRNGLFNSVKDINKALDIESTKGDFRDTEQTRKNWWFSKNFNKLDEQGKKDYLQKLYKEGQLDKEIMLEAVELLREGYANGDISLTGVQMLWVGQFADMTGVGKAAGAPRMIPVIPMPDGTFKIATDADLVKAGLAYSKDPYVLEHMIPAKEIATLSLQYILSGDAQIKKELLKKLENYDTSILPKKLDDKLKKERGTQEMMGIDFKTGDSPVDTRYDGLGIMFYDAKNDTFVGSPIKYSKSELTKVKTDQKAIDNGRSISWSKSPKKIRVFDFDDTLARTKSNVLYTMPGEVRIFHGGDIKSVKDIDGFVYFSEDQKQASAYAKGNQGDVSSFKIDETSIATEDQVFDVINALNIKPRAGYEVDESNLYELVDPRFEQSFSKKDLEKLAVALKRKGIKAARFTDTDISQGKNEGRETENIVVFDKKAVQEQSKLTAAEFAAKSDEMAAKGADFDFIEFSKVMSGKEGPLLKVAKIIAEKRGTEDLFVLTARPQDAAGPIQEFLAELGLDIPLENITGLADGDPKAKANWMVGKVAEGYNDFYFADDAIKNVKAVKDVFDTFDIKGKVQQAKVKFSKGLDKGFNDMIERQTGTESFKEFSKGVAQRRGKKVGKFKIFVSPSAEDFRGLTQYKFAGKGKQGEADQKFFEEALMDPYFKGVAAVEAARETIKNDTKALFKIFKPVKKKLNKLVPGIDFTYDGAVRVYLWNKAGIEIPGLTKRDNKKLNDAIANDPELSAFADALLLVSKQDTWPAPGEYWEAKTTLSDLNTLTEKTNRKEYLTEFIENVDIIFSEKNLNKVEALYGKASRTAIENAIYAMKTGSNSPNQNGDGITNRWLKWVNNSIGTIMFFNRRSALLQLTSATNFLNWSDNNPAKAALAFANQPQYWKDWAMIFNSDKLKQRRSGLKSDVQESEIANAAKNTEDKIGSIIAYLLKIGFSPTQIADSIAISSGGATFYRNRVNTYKKQGLDVKEAETKAFEDMSKLSDEAQQSGDPALVSQQQRSVAGRLILSFQNTTMQYTRLMKKAGQDLINGRGDAKTHVSKILYYGALQNFIFNALSQTAFALIPGFDEEEEEDKVKRDEKLEEKASRVLNGMTDSIIRGTGIYGAVVTTLKNTFNTWEREADKGFKGDQAKTILEAANISPAIGSKLRKIYSAIQAYQFDKAIMEKHPWSVTIDGKFNPSATYSVIGNVASATLNIPLDRALAEARGVAEMFDNRNSEMQRIALALGWRTWNVGAKNEEFDLIKMEAKQAKKDKKAEEKAQYKAYLKRVGSKLSLEEANAYRRIKSAKLKKEYILKIGEEKGIK